MAGPALKTCNHAIHPVIITAENCPDTAIHAVSNKSGKVPLGCLTCGPVTISDTLYPTGDHCVNRFDDYSSTSA